MPVFWKQNSRIPKIRGSILQAGKMSTVYSEFGRMAKVNIVYVEGLDVSEAFKMKCLVRNWEVQGQD